MQNRPLNGFLAKSENPERLNLYGDYSFAEAGDMITGENFSSQAGRYGHNDELEQYLEDEFGIRPEPQHDRYFFEGFYGI